MRHFDLLSSIDMCSLAISPSLFVGVGFLILSFGCTLVSSKTLIIIFPFPIKKDIFIICGVVFSEKRDSQFEVFVVVCIHVFLSSSYNLCNFF